MFDSIDAEELGNYAQLGEEQSEDRVEALKDVALDYIERYTGRALEKKARTERYPARRKVLLKAWPVESVESVTADGVELAEDEYDLDGERGILTIKAERRADALTISYTGGFTEATLPTKAGFETGKKTLLELNESKTRYHKAESDLLQARYEYLYRCKILEFYKAFPL